MPVPPQSSRRLSLGCGRFLDRSMAFGSRPIPTTAQLLVVAPPQVHAAIEDQLAVAKSPVTKPAVPPRLWDEPDSNLRLRPAAAMAGVDGGERSNNAVSAGARRRGPVAAAAATVLGGRLRRVCSATASRPTCSNRRTGPVAELVFDVRRGGVLVTANERVLQQLVLLFRALESHAAGEGRRTAVVSIERSDPAQLQQTIDAFRATAPQAGRFVSTAATSGWNGGWPW